MDGDTETYEATTEPTESAVDECSTANGRDDGAVDACMATPSLPTDSHNLVAISVPCTAQYSLSNSVPAVAHAAANGGRVFTQLVQQSWEHYKLEDANTTFADLNEPLQMLQDLSLCNPTSLGMSLGKQIEQGIVEHSTIPSFAPSALRYTHSSPTKISRSSEPGLASSGKPGLASWPPPPIPLDPFHRSTSTPSAFRQQSNYSAFGTADSSAFTLPSQRFAKSGSTTGTSAFGPVQFYSMALEDMERTSIEVEDTTVRTKESTGDVQQKSISRRGAAFRAARYLSDVRVFRRKRRARDGRENPAQPTSVSSASKEVDTEKEDSPLDTSVTIITENDYNANDESMLSGSSEMSAIVNGLDIETAASECGNDDLTEPGGNITCLEVERTDMASAGQQYQHLGSDVEDNEEVQYQPLGSELHEDSSAGSPAAYEKLDDVCAGLGHGCGKSHGDSTSTTPAGVEIARGQKLRFTMALESTETSPSPTRMLDCQNLTPGSTESAITQNSMDSGTTSHRTTRSSLTVSSSGHATQATATSAGTGHFSSLSTISETDREVMEANKDARTRRGLETPSSNLKDASDLSSHNSTSTTSTNPNRYFSLAGSPIGLREGANVPLDRFLNGSVSLNQPSPLVGSQTNSTCTSSRSRTSGNTTSPSASESLSATHTSSSGSSSGQAPPKFVSYRGRALTSDPASFREATEDSTRRSSNADVEEREESPSSEMLSLSFEETVASSQIRSSRFDRLRSRRRPPRSPSKGSRSLKTPPQLGSVSPLLQHLSPPRDIVNHADSNVARPAVTRSASNLVHLPTSSSRFQTRSDVALSPIPSRESMLIESQPLLRGSTYVESNIEVSANGSEDMAGNVVTPEKDI